MEHNINNIMENILNIQKELEIKLSFVNTPDVIQSKISLPELMNFDDSLYPKPKPFQGKTIKVKF